MQQQEWEEFVQKLRGTADDVSESSNEKQADEPRNGNIEFIDNQG